MRRAVWFMLAIGALLRSTVARAEIFILGTGGQVRGELLNPDESPRRTYVVKTASGGVVTLERAQVKKIRKPSAAELEYEQIKGDYPDTADGNWNLAVWCRDHKLVVQRKAHLERVIALDPEHGDARRALGYSHDNGRWVTSEEWWTSRGYVRYKGKWRLPQEVEVAEQEEHDDQAAKAWYGKLKRWRSWLGGPRDREAREELAAVRDPYAVKALAAYLGEESEADYRLLFVDALARVGTPGACNVLAATAIEDPHDEVRIVCLDHLVEAEYKPAVGVFIAKLKSKNNEVVNRAGAALGRMKDPAAIGPLIDALVTEHKFKIERGGNPGQINSTFGTGPGGTGGLPGFSFGQPKPVIVKKALRNRDVLSALVTLTDGVNFDFDTRAWKYWYASQKKSSAAGGRRD